MLRCTATAIQVLLRQACRVRWPGRHVAGLAQLMKRPKATVSSWLSGRRRMPAQAMELFAEVLRREGHLFIGIADDVAHAARQASGQPSPRARISNYQRLAGRQRNYTRWTLAWRQNIEAPMKLMNSKTFTLGGPYDLLAKLYSDIQDFDAAPTWNGSLRAYRSINCFLFFGHMADWFWVALRRRRRCLQKMESRTS